MEALQHYLLDHSQPQDPVLAWLEHQTHCQTVHPRMLSGEPMGSFLTFLVQQIRPQRILEIGTFTGYSAICMAKGLQAVHEQVPVTDAPQPGTPAAVGVLQPAAPAVLQPPVAPVAPILDTIEIVDEQEALIREAFERSGVQSIVRLHIGDALQVIPTLAAAGARYQLIYIDGNKRQYVAYYNLAKSLLDPGGVILADNVLWDNKVLDATQQDAQTRGIRDFNEAVHADAGARHFLLPLFDGLMVVMPATSR